LKCPAPNSKFFVLRKNRAYFFEMPKALLGERFSFSNLFAMSKTIRRPKNMGSRVHPKKISTNKPEKPFESLLGIKQFPQGIGKSVDYFHGG